MEITFSRTVNYSLTLEAMAKRELADHLDITVRKMDKLVADGDFYDEHGDELVNWMETKKFHAYEITGEDDIEIEEING